MVPPTIRRISDLVSGKSVWYRDNSVQKQSFLTKIHAIQKSFILRRVRTQAYQICPCRARFMGMRWEETV